MAEAAEQEREARNISRAGTGGEIVISAIDWPADSDLPGRGHAIFRGTTFDTYDFRDKLKALPELQEEVNCAGHPVSWTKPDGSGTINGALVPSIPEGKQCIILHMCAAVHCAPTGKVLTLPSPLPPTAEIRTTPSRWAHDAHPDVEPQPDH